MSERIEANQRRFLETQRSLRDRFIEQWIRERKRLTLVKQQALFNQLLQRTPQEYEEIEREDDEGNNRQDED